MRILNSQSRIGATPIYGRLAWLDEVRLVAVLMMILDHALFFFPSEEAWAATLRLTLTRSAEPLFVFVFTYLNIYLGHSMRPTRWFQMVFVSVITSMTLSRFLGCPVADILASIAAVALLLPLLLTIPRACYLLVLYATAMVAALPIGFAGFAFDYSPALIIYQVLLVRVFCEKGDSSALRHGALSTTVLVAASAGCTVIGITPSASVFAVLFGHPLAAILIKALMEKENHSPTRLTRIASRPLTVYATHLLAFAAIAEFAKLVS